jgi:hypothetical protein
MRSGGDVYADAVSFNKGDNGLIGNVQFAVVRAQGDLSLTNGNGGHSGNAGK